MDFVGTRRWGSRVSAPPSQADIKCWEHRAEAASYRGTEGDPAEIMGLATLCLANADSRGSHRISGLVEELQLHCARRLPLVNFSECEDIMKLLAGSRVLLLSLVGIAALYSCRRAAAQDANDKPIVASAAAAKFTTIPVAPKCFTIAVDKGDPFAGPSVILARFAPGCVAPFHWHTPNESVMAVSGSLELQMKDDKPMVAHHGDYLYLPSHHAHRATCRGAAPCLVFLTSDAAFDIHWVDDSGKEISLEDAVANVKQAKKRP